MPTAWAYRTPWEDLFTVVHYEQRGVEKNAVSTNREALAASLTFDPLVPDAEDLVAWVRRKLGVERVIVVGSSYGTATGLALAERTPEWISAYVGVGQMRAGGDAYPCPRLLAIARERTDTTALRELESIAPSSRPGAPVSAMLLTRKCARQFDGGWYGKPTFDLLCALPQWAPEDTDADRAAQTEATPFASRTLTRGGRSPLPDTVGVPVVIMQGKHDLRTPYAPAHTWFDRLQAPLTEVLPLKTRGR